MLQRHCTDVTSSAGTEKEKERESRRLTRGVESRAAGIRIGDGITSVSTVTVWCAG